MKYVAYPISSGPEHMVALIDREGSVVAAESFLVALESVECSAFALPGSNVVFVDREGSVEAGDGFLVALEIEE